MSDIRVWVGCLACYNAGRLIGEWVDATEAADSASDAAWAEAVHGGVASDEPLSSHEEWWVMDIDDPHGLITKECSPDEAQRIAEWVELVEEEGHDIDAVRAYGEAFSIPFGPDLVLADFEESYAGHWDSREDYAQQFAEDIGAVDPDASWPNSYIDWERAARDLFLDYYDEPASGGGIHVFRSI